MSPVEIQKNRPIVPPIRNTKAHRIYPNIIDTVGLPVSYRGYNGTVLLNLNRTHQRIEPSDSLIRGKDELEKVLQGLFPLVFEKPSHCDDFSSFSF